MRCRGRSLRGDTSDARIPLWAALAPSVSSFEIGHRVASITCSAPPPPYSLEPTASPTIAPVSTTRLGELHGLKVIFLDTPTCLARNKRQKSHLLALDRPHAHEVVQLPERHEPVFPAAGEISDSPTTKSKQTEHSLRISYLNARERTSTLFCCAGAGTKGRVSKYTAVHRRCNKCHAYDTCALCGTATKVIFAL